MTSGLITQLHPTIILTEKSYRYESQYFHHQLPFQVPYQAFWHTGWSRWTEYVEYLDGDGFSLYVEIAHRRVQGHISHGWLIIGLNFKDWRHFHHFIRTFWFSSISTVPINLPLFKCKAEEVSIYKQLSLHHAILTGSDSVSRILAMRIEKDQPSSAAEQEEKFSWGQVGKAYKSPHVLLTSLALFMIGTNLYSLAYFQPTSQSIFDHQEGPNLC